MIKVVVIHLKFTKNTVQKEKGSIQIVSLKTAGSLLKDFMRQVRGDKINIAPMLTRKKVLGSVELNTAVEWPQKKS